MKIVQSVAALYEQHRILNERLHVKVDETFNNFKRPGWFYLSRLKTLESFALKIETGRFAVSKGLEDFFACTLVVANLTEINEAAELVAETFDVQYRRPQDFAYTHKEPSSFQFDDLRIYAKLRTFEFLPPEPINEIIFEIQIKTFLQHAWGRATHDLMYKSDEINWSKERIAFQIKAMLEQAEVTISGVNGLIALPEVTRENREIREQKAVLEFYKENFLVQDLPNDVVRLCKTTKDLLDALKIPLAEFIQIMEVETAAGRGLNLKNLSPYLVILQSLINQKKAKIEEYINNGERKKYKLLIPKEVDLNGISIKEQENVVII